MSNVALYGGSFDPPHIGHILTITALLNSQIVEEVWLVPHSEEKTDNFVRGSEGQRKDMVNLMLQESFPREKRIKLVSPQLERQLPHAYTYELVRYMENTYPSETFFLVIGSDKLEQIPSWKNAAALLEQVHFVILPRAGRPIQSALPQKAVVVEESLAIQSNASSSVVRNMVRRGELLNGIVPRSVINYIAANELYFPRKNA